MPLVGFVNENGYWLVLASKCEPCNDWVYPSLTLKPQLKYTGHVVNLSLNILIASTHSHFQMASKIKVLKPTVYQCSIIMRISTTICLSAGLMIAT